MARSVKVGNEFENLSGYNTFITDEKPNSFYFRITKFADTFTAGKNLFLIEGSECLKESTEVKIEIVDAEGGTLYVEPGRGVPDYYEGNSVVLSARVYETTPVGPAKITILGELKEYYDEDGIKRPVPEEWENAYNVKWEKDFYINKNEKNSTPVIFYKKPSIEIDEIESTVVEQSVPITTQTGSIIGRAENPPLGTDLNTWRAGTLYRLERNDGDGFKSSMDENTIRIPSLNYEATIKEVINTNTLLVDTPFTDDDNKIVNDLTPSDYSVTFQDFGARTTNDSAVTSSFGRITLKNLDTFTGNVDKLKIYKKSRSDVGDFKFQDEVKIVNGNLLRDPFVPGSDLDGGFGRITENNINRYWDSSSIQISGSDSSLSFDDDLLYESVKINIPSSSQQTESLDLITNQTFNLFADTDYELNFRTLVSGSFQDTIPGKVTVVSESYARTYYYKFDDTKIKTFNPTFISRSSETDIASPNSQSVDFKKPFVYDASRISLYDTPQNQTGSIYTSIPSGYSFSASHDSAFVTFDTSNPNWNTNSRTVTNSDNKANVVANSGSFSGKLNLMVWLDSGSFNLPTSDTVNDISTIIETFQSSSEQIALIAFKDVETDARFYYKHSSTELNELESFRTSTEYDLEIKNPNDFSQIQNTEQLISWNTGSQVIFPFNSSGYHYIHLDYRTLRDVEPLNAELITVKRLDSLDGDILYGTTYEINSINFETGDISFSHDATEGTISGVLSLINGQAVLTIGSNTNTHYLVELDFEQGIMVFVGELDFTELEPAQRSYDLYDLFDLSGSSWVSTGSTDLFVPRIPPRAGDYLYTDNGYPYSSTEFSDRNFLTTEFTSPSSSDDNFSNPLQIPYIFRNDDDIIENVYVEESDQIYVVSSVSSSTDINNTEYIYDQGIDYTGFFFSGSYSGSLYVDESLHTETYKTSLDSYNTLITAHNPISSSFGELNFVLLTDSGSSQIPTNTGSLEFHYEEFQSGSTIRSALALRNIESDAKFYYNNSLTSQSVLESYSGSTNISLDTIDSGDFTNTQLWFLSTGSQVILDFETGSDSHFFYIDYRTNRNSEPLNADLQEITAISQIGTTDFTSLTAREIFEFTGSVSITGSVTSTNYVTSQLPLIAGNTIYTSDDYPFIPSTISDGTYITDDVDPNTDVTIPDTILQIPYVFNTVDGKVENVLVKRLDAIFTASSVNGTGTTQFTEPAVFVSQSLVGPETVVPKTITAFITGSYKSGSTDVPFTESLVTITADAGFSSRKQFQHLFTNTTSGSGKLGFSFRGDGWQLSKIDLKPLQDENFSPKVFDLFDEQDRTLPVETFDYRFELYDINNNFIPVELKASKEFSGGNKISQDTVKILTFESDRTAFRFYSGSLANPPFQQVKFNFSKTTALSSSITFESSAFDKNGNYIDPSSYTGQYPGALTNVTSTNALLTIANFSGSDTSYEVGSIIYTASVQNVEEFETIFRLDDGQPVSDLIVNNDRPVVTYKQSSGEIDPSNQVTNITVKRKNLASNTETITANSSSLIGNAPPLTLLSDDSTSGIATYFVSGSSISLESGSITYSFTSSDEFDVEISNSTTVTPISFLGGVVLYLSNERGVLPAYYSGIIPSSSYVYTSGSTKLYVDGEEVTYNNSGGTNTYKITGVTGSGITPNETQPTTNEYGGVAGTMGEESSSLEINVRYTDSSGEAYDFSRTANFNIVREGEAGQPGLEGSNGPGLVLTGEWTGSRDYQVTTGSLARRDAVISGSEFYLAISASGPSHGGAVNPNDSNYWESLGTASRFVAAELAVFSESYIQNTLNVGTNNDGNTSAANITIAGGTDAPYISMGQGATTGTQGYNVGDGIFLGFNGNNDNTASFSLENGLTGDELLWDGSTLNIRGNITVTNNEDFITPTDTGSFTKNESTSSLENPTIYSFGPDASFTLEGVTPSTSGLYLGSGNMGYYDNSSSSWKTYMDDSGRFYLGGTGGALQWNGSQLSIEGDITVTNTGDFAPSDAEANDPNQDNPSSYNFGPVDDSGFDMATIEPGSTQGLYIGSNNLGYHDGSNWKTYMSSLGQFYLGGTSGALTWDGSTLNIEGNITVTNTDDFAPTDAEANPSNYDFGPSATFDLNTVGTPLTEGLYLGSDNLGYHDGTNWNAYMDSNGRFYLGGTSGALTWDGSNLTVNGSGTFTGTVSGGSIVGGTINIGSGNFTVDSSGNMDVASTIDLAAGGEITIGTNGSLTSTGFNLTNDTLTIQSYVNDLTAGGIGPGDINGGELQFDKGPDSYFGSGAGSAIRGFSIYNLSTSHELLLMSDRISFTTFTNPGGSFTGYGHFDSDGLYVDGDIDATGNITAYYTSDLRLKKNIKLIQDPLDKLKEINGVTFDWKEGFTNIHKFEGNDIGVIAQEVESVIPNIVRQHKTNGYRSVQYDKLTPLLIEAVKELSKKVDSLEKEIKQLKG